MRGKTQCFEHNLQSQNRNSKCATDCLIKLKFLLHNFYFYKRLKFKNVQVKNSSIPFIVVL